MDPLSLLFGALAGVVLGVHLLYGSEVSEIEVRPASRFVEKSENCSHPEEAHSAVPGKPQIVKCDRCEAVLGALS